jgi:hypothetical protein
MPELEDVLRTDVQSCYVLSCQNNNALKCDLVRISIGTDGVCMAYIAIEEAAE